MAPKEPPGRNLAHFLAGGPVTKSKVSGPSHVPVNFVMDRHSGEILVVPAAPKFSIGRAMGDVFACETTAERQHRKQRKFVKGHVSDDGEGDEKPSTSNELVLTGKGGSLMPRGFVRDDKVYGLLAEHKKTQEKMRKETEERERAYEEEYNRLERENRYLLEAIQEIDDYRASASAGFEKEKAREKAVAARWEPKLDAIRREKEENMRKMNAKKPALENRLERLSRQNLRVDGREDDSGETAEKSEEPAPNKATVEAGNASGAEGDDDGATVATAPAPVSPSDRPLQPVQDVLAVHSPLQIDTPAAVLPPRLIPAAQTVSTHMLTSGLGCGAITRVPKALGWPSVSSLYTRPVRATFRRCVVMRIGVLSREIAWTFNTKSKNVFRTNRRRMAHMRRLASELGSLPSSVTKRPPLQQVFRSHLITGLADQMHLKRLAKALEPQSARTTRPPPLADPKVDFSVLPQRASAREQQPGNHQMVVQHFPPTDRDSLASDASPRPRPRSSQQVPPLGDLFKQSLLQQEIPEQVDSPLNQSPLPTARPQQALPQTASRQKPVRWVSQAKETQNITQPSEDISVDGANDTRGPSGGLLGKANPGAADDSHDDLSAFWYQTSSMEGAVDGSLGAKVPIDAITQPRQPGPSNTDTSPDEHLADKSSSQHISPEEIEPPPESTRLPLIHVYSIDEASPKEITGSFAKGQKAPQMMRAMVSLASRDRSRSI